MSNDFELWAPEPGDADYVKLPVPHHHLNVALALVKEMRDRMGNARYLYTEDLFLVATSEALGNLEHHLKKAEEAA
jgi:hypothetical protein